MTVTAMRLSCNGLKRVVLVSQDSEGRDREPPTQVSSASVPTLPASSGAIRRLLLVNGPCGGNIRV